MNKAILILKNYFPWLNGLIRSNDIMIKGEEIKEVNAKFYRSVWRKDKRYIDRKTGLPTSRAFSPRPKDEGKLSVDIDSLITPEESVGDTLKFSLWEIENSLVYSIDLISVYDPLTEKFNGRENPAHCLIMGFDEEDESKAGILARESRKVDI